VLAGAVLLACGPPEHDSWPPTGDARLLSGTWEVTLRRGAWTRVVPVGGAVVRGRLTLKPSGFVPYFSDAAERRPCAGCLSGTFSLPASEWFPPARSDVAQAAVFEDGSALIMLSVDGNCTDCGNLFLKAHLGVDRATGGWAQEFIGTGLTGAFVLRRVLR
jgi:hypothetical protein